jgi:ammonium transporter, Amt family
MSSMISSGRCRVPFALLSLWCFTFGALLYSSGFSFAQEAAAEAAPAAEAPAAEPPAPAAPAVLDKGDEAWMLASSALVLLMTPGLAFFYGGLVRRKNVLSVLMQCFLCMGIVSILWVVCGFSIAFGPDTAGGFMGDPREFFMLNKVMPDQAWVPTENPITISQQTFMIFQCMFAIITPGLIVGAFAERMKFSAFAIFLVAWSLLVYCPIAHWVWWGSLGIGNYDPNGISIGALDFAGGTVVHINAGIAALVCCFVLGKRADVPKGGVPPHNLPFAVLGAGLLWFGWFGFNAGSAFGANPQAVSAFVCTHMAAAAAAVAWSIIEWIMHGRPTMLGMITGAVAGLVAITPAAGFVNVGPALIIGAVASLICYIFVAQVKPMVGYDDALDVFGVHGIGGIWGAIATGIFANKGFGLDKAGGLIHGNTDQVFLQIKAVVFTLGYSAVATLVILYVIKFTIGVRTSEEGERMGLDVTDHAIPAYSES